MAHIQQQQFFLELKEKFPNRFINCSVLDIGSLDINGNNRYLFENYTYVGVDVGVGPNVDVVCKGHEYSSDILYDVVISSECFEHDMFYPQTIKNCVKLTKPGGLFTFTCASTGRPEHGTLRCSPQDSPFSILESNWSDYYKNLTEQDIREVINIEDHFQEYEFIYNGGGLRSLLLGNQKIDMTNFTICITTFSKRFNFLEKLIKQIRTYTNKDILITINGDYKKNFNEEYRKNILDLCLKYENIFPIFFPEQRGLSKLWNTLIIHSKSDWSLILNDDIEILSNDIFVHAENNLPNKYDLLRINGSFSHFFIHKNCIDELGYFDERLLGFGEEDGDISYRYIELYDRWIQDLYINGLNNLVVDIRDENIIPGVGKYSLFNRDFCFLNKNPKYQYQENCISGMFGQPMKKMIEDVKLYPYESFFNENKKNL